MPVPPAESMELDECDGGGGGAGTAEERPAGRPAAAGRSFDERFDEASALVHSENAGVPLGGDLQWYWASFIFINAMVGVGLLNFPYAIRVAGGVPLALGIQVLFAAATFGGANGMIWCGQMANARYYQDTVRACLGPAGYAFALAAIVLNVAFVTCTYVISVGEQLAVGAEIVLGVETLSDLPWYAGEPAMKVASTLLVVFPLCCVSHMDKLAAASCAATGSVLLVGAIIVYEFAALDTSDVVMKVLPTRWTDVFLSLPAFSAAYMYIGTAESAYSRFARRRQREFAKSAALATAFVYCANNAFGAVSYATFGEATKANFMSNYRTKNAAVAIAQITYSIKLMLEYPVYQFVGWTAIRNTIGIVSPKTLSSADDDLTPTIGSWHRVGTSLLWTCLTLSIGLAAENINAVLPLSGTINMLLMLVVPGACVWRVAGLQRVECDHGYGWRLGVRLFAVVLVVMGLFLSVCVFVEYVKNR